MDTTRATLLGRVKDRSDDSAWRDFNRLYFPLLFRYARVRGLPAADAEDVAQQCMQKISGAMSTFEYSSSRGKFRSWLRLIAERTITDHFRKHKHGADGSMGPDRAERSDNNPEALWDRQWEKEHLRHCLEQLQREIPAKTFEIFRLYALEQKPAAEVAQRLGVSESLVWTTKSRILDRLQAQMNEWYDGA